MGDTVTVDAAELVAGLRVASLAVAREPSRYAIDGVLLESDDKGTRLAATDGRRLVVVGLHTVESEFSGRAILPGRLVRLVEKLTDKHTDYLVLSVARQKTDKGEEVPGHLFAAGPDWLLSMYESEGHFPLYRDVMPRSHSKFAIGRDNLVELLAEVALATSEDSRMVRLDLSPQQVHLSAASAGVGESAATLARRVPGGWRCSHPCRVQPGVPAGCTQVARWRHGDDRCRSERLWLRPQGLWQAGASACPARSADALGRHAGQRGSACDAREPRFQLPGGARRSGRKRVRRTSYEATQTSLPGMRRAGPRDA